MTPKIWLSTIDARAKRAVVSGVGFPAFLQMEFHDHLWNPPTRMPRRQWTQAIVSAWRNAGGELDPRDEPDALPYIRHAKAGTGARRKQRKVDAVRTVFLARATIEQLAVMQRDANPMATGKRPYHKSRKVLRAQIERARAKINQPLP